jgi:hypothetical protein
MELATLLYFIIALACPISAGLDKPWAASLMAANKEALLPPCPALAEENSYCALIKINYL